MTLPNYDSAKHDVGINGKGFMRASDREGAIQVQDQVPATSRAAEGEGRYDSFQSESFRAQATWTGGVGQGRFRAADMALTGIANTRHEGHCFPPYASKTTGSTGGATSGYFTRSGTLYGMLATTLEDIAAGTAYTSSLPVRTGQRPVVSAANNVFWVSSSNTLLKWSGSGAVSDITTNLGRGVTPYAADQLGRFLWCIGKRTFESTSGIAQTTNGSSSLANVTLALTSVPRQTSTLVLALMYSHDDAPVTTTFDNTDWTERVNYTDTDTTPNPDLTVAVYTLQNPTTADRFVRYELSAATAHYYVLLEVEGIDPVASFVDAVGISYATGTATSSRPTGTVSSETGINLIFTANDTDSVTFTAPTNYTELIDLDGGAFRVFVGYRADTTDTVTGSVAPNSTTGDQVNVLLKLRSNSITADLDQTVFLYSSDDGTSWDECFNGDSAGIPLPIATVATQGALWITTESGLYEFRYDEREFEDHTISVIGAARGPVDHFHYPADANGIGTCLTTWDGALYYNLGATFRRYAPGGNANQIWPTPTWATTGGTIKAMVAGEGGVYFSAGGYLWNYNGRGFHQMAKEASSGDFDVLFWHDGKLYTKGDPAPYFNYQYPSLRPDLGTITVSDFTTGYLVTSEIDFDKVSVIKVIRAFELQGRFTGGTTAAESGTLKLEYALGCSGSVDPGAEGGAAASTTWTTIGTMSVEDGGTKAFTLGTPLACKRIFLRVTITPGSVGIPDLIGYTAYGRAVMPSTVRIVAPVHIYTGQKDKAGTVMYPDEATVKEAVDHLRALREATSVNYFTVNVTDEVGGSEDYVCTAETMNSWLTWQKRDSGLGAMCQFAASELPS